MKIDTQIVDWYAADLVMLPKSKGDLEKAVENLITEEKVRELVINKG